MHDLPLELLCCSLMKVAVVLVLDVDNVEIELGKPDVELIEALAHGEMKV